jgi:hypothetical protein
MASVLFSLAAVLALGVMVGLLFLCSQHETSENHMHGPNKTRGLIVDHRRVTGLNMDALKFIKPIWFIPRVD